MRYIIKAIPGGYRAEIPIQLPDGAMLRISARATFNEVRRDLARQRGSVQGAYEQATMEGFFGDVGRFIKKVTKSKALRKAVKITGRVVKHPAFSAAVAAEKLITNATRAPKGSRKRIAARTIIKAASAVAKREAKQRRLGKAVARPRGGSTEARAFRYLVQLAPAA